MRIEDLVVELSKDPFNPTYNFEVAKAYEELTQTASAVCFYHRTAEHGYETHPDLVYASLIRITHCFFDQSDRVNTVSNTLLQAVAYMPERPEAYLLLSQHYERLQLWQECYSWATMGLARAAKFKGKPLPINSGYYGPYCFEFEQAVSGWWLGRKDESISLFHKLKGLKYIAEEYKAAIENNLRSIDATV